MSVVTDDRGIVTPASTPAPPAVGNLALSRREGESVVITLAGGETIVFRMGRQLSGGKTRIHFQAPLNVHIVRGELLDTRAD